MFRSSLPRCSLPTPAVRLLRVVPRPAGLALAAVAAAGLAAAVPALPASAASGSCAGSSGQVTCTFTETGGAQTWTVPGGVTTATFRAYGAQGSAGGGGGAQGGPGGEATAIITVHPGDTVEVVVGGSGGFNGGGAGGSAVGAPYSGGSGGGASDIRMGTCAATLSCGLGDRVLIGAGGGGGGGQGHGGSGGAGGATGGNGNGGGGGGSGGGATGATATTFGTGGAAASSSAGCPGGQGANGSAGAGGGGGSNNNAGGGGGGGLFGGGGGGGGCEGGGGGGGGGGSSYGPMGATTYDDASWSGNGQVTISFTVPPLTVTTTSLPVGVAGSSYSQPVAVTGGLAPYTWSVSSGSLPPGLNLDPSTGTISGTPMTAGTYTFTVQVTDSASETASSQTLSITVNPALAVSTTSLPAATGGQSYTATLTASGGIPPYGEWSVLSGSLPPGLTLDAATGVISGAPDVAGTYSFKVTVTDSENPAVTATSGTLSISVSGPVITAIRPDSGPSFGFTPVLITGTGLSCPPRDRSCKVTVTFGGRRALVALARPDEIVALSPAGSGTVTVTVTVGGVSSQATTATRFTYLRFF
jgi:hypothetical protein